MAIQTQVKTAKCSGQYGAYYTLTLTITENNAFLSNGKAYSNVTITLTRTRASSSYTNYGWNNPTNITINGSVWATATPVSSHNVDVTQTLISHTADIEHNADDTINVTASFTSSSPSLSGGSVTDTMVLTKVAVATPCPTFTGDIRDTVPISINPSSDLYNHSLYYTLNGVETLICNFASGVRTVNYTIPTSLASLLTQTTSGTLPLVLKTYYNGDLIGTSNNNATISLKPSDYTPTINSVTLVDTNQDTIALTGDANKIIAFKSDIQATVDYQAGLGANFFYLGALYELTNDYYRVLDFIQAPNTGNTLEFRTPPQEYVTYGNRLDSIKGFIIDFIDSRYQHAYYQFSSDDSRFIPYSPIYWDAPNTFTVLSRPTVLAQTMYLSFSFEWWKGQFPNGTDNDIVVEWRVKRKQDSDSEWSAWQTISQSDYNTYEYTSYPISFPNRATSLTGTITFDEETGEVVSKTETPIAIENPLDINNDGNPDITWDYLTNYQFEIRARDLLDSAIIKSEIHSSTSIFDAFQTPNGDKYFNINGKILQNNRKLNRYAEVHTSSVIHLSQNTQDDISFTTFSASSGDFTLSNGKLYVPTGTETLEVGGCFGGLGNIYFVIDIIDTSTGLSVGNIPSLMQPSGNNYFLISTPSKIIDLNPTHTYYITAVASGYNMSAELNDGFMSNSTYVWARVLN